MTEQGVGKLLNGKYRLLSILGEGAMGVVYRAEQLDVKGRPLREVALKTLRPALSSDENFSRRFLDEVRAAAQLRSAHVVTLYDVGTDEDGQIYYTMEFVRGQTLKEVIQRDGPLPLPRVVAMVDQICEALMEAHSLPYPIVHRDLKPANIFVEERQSEELVKVGDFGIAKILGEQHTQHTAVGTPGPGTPRYMAPEQWKGQELSNRTDLYSLGCLIYELLTAKPPFVAQGGGIEALMYQHLTQSPPSLPDTIPAEIRSLARRLMAKEPAERPHDALTVRQTLAAVLGGREEEKTVILADTEDVITTRTPEAPQQNAVAQAREVVRPQFTSSPRPEEKFHKKRILPHTGKTRRVITWSAVALGIFFGGGALFSRDGWEKYWLQTLTKLQSGPSVEKKDEIASVQGEPTPEAVKGEQEPSLVAKPDTVSREDQKTAQGTADSQAAPDEKPSRDQPSSSPSASASSKTNPPEPPQPPPQGSLSVAVNVETAKVSLNGTYIGVARSGTPLEIAKLAIGQQQVRVEADGYESLEQKASVQDGKETKLELTLTRLLSAPPAASLPVPPNSSRSFSPPVSDQQQVLPPSQKNENAPAVTLYDRDGKPISKSQIERKRRVLRNRERRRTLSSPRASSGPRNRQTLQDLPRPRPTLPRN